VFGVGERSAQANLPCVSYEGTDLPENEGWERITYGGGAELELDLVPGALVIDGSASINISDFYDYPITTLPEPGQACAWNGGCASIN